MTKEQSQQNRAKIFSTNGAGTNRYPYAKKQKTETTKKTVNLDLDLKSIPKINSKWVTNLNAKCKTIKFLKEKNRYLGYNDALLDITAKAQFMKRTIDKLDFIQKLLLCERQSQENETFAKDITDKGSLSKI